MFGQDDNDDDANACFQNDQYNVYVVVVDDDYDYDDNDDDDYNRLVSGRGSWCTALEVATTQ